MAPEMSFAINAITFTNLLIESENQFVKVAVSFVFQFWALSTIMSFLKGLEEIFVKEPN